jgi:hypothetical protein
MFGCVSTNVAFLAGVVVAASFHCVLLDEDLGCSYVGRHMMSALASFPSLEASSCMTLSLGSCCELR